MIEVRIFGTPTACATGISDSWKRMAGWVRTQLQARYGDVVRVQYYDVFSREAEQFSDALDMVRDGHPLPLVFIGSEMLSSGGKISVSRDLGIQDSSQAERSWHPSGRG